MTVERTKRVIAAITKRSNGLMPNELWMDERNWQALRRSVVKDMKNVEVIYGGTALTVSRLFVCGVECKSWGEK
jgi:hypothetical protein